MPSFKEKETTIDKVPQNNPKDELELEEFTEESGVEIASNSSSKKKVDDDYDDEDNSNNKIKIMIVMMMVMK
jgi:hypothetical protein